MVTKQYDTLVLVVAVVDGCSSYVATSLFALIVVGTDVVLRSEQGAGFMILLPQCSA